MPIETLAAAVAIILLAFVIRGITGFGSGLIAVPLLAHFLPLQFVVPFILVLDVTAAATLLGGQGLRQVRWDELKPLVPFGVIGVLLGVSLLMNLPKTPLLLGLGIFVLIFGLRSLLDLHGERSISRLWAVPAGLTGGTVGALFGTGGPPYVIYLSHRLHDKSQLRATFSGLFMIEGSLRVALFLATGLLLQENMATALLLALPVSMLGLYLGHHIHLGIGRPQIMRLIGLLLLGSGASLMWKALA
jgi:uncharacterized membrane protein YfcA